MSCKSFENFIEVEELPPYYSPNTFAVAAEVYKLKF
jgi:hypothetical protein